MRLSDEIKLSMVKFALMFAVALLLGSTATYIGLQAREVIKRDAERQNWHRMALATEIGKWALNINTGVLSWDEPCFTLYDTDKTQWKGTYDSFLIQVDERDREWVNLMCQRTMKNEGYYRAVFKLSNGRYIRAYGSVFYNQKEKIFAGICIPASADEYIGKPFVSQNVSTR